VRGEIDVHHHILPSFYVAALEGIGITTSFGLPFPKWSPEEAIEVMDKNSIATAITSISTPGVYFKESSFSRDLARRCNEYSAQLMREYPDRFGAFASLPLPDVEGALNEGVSDLDTLVNEKARHRQITQHIRLWAFRPCPSGHAPFGRNVVYAGNVVRHTEA